MIQKQMHFQIHPEISVDEAWEKLTEAGVHALYSSEDPEGAKEIVGILPAGLLHETLLEQCPCVASITPFVIEDIDWTAQWAAHGMDFHNGYVHLDLCKLGFPLEELSKWRTLRLQPGPGFGDMSHPTTQLVLRLMNKSVRNQYVLDIGSGSGVLTLCAVALGANHAHGFDIDPTALVHARHNAELNQMQDYTSFGLPEGYQLPKNISSAIILMNMIHTEQKVAWESLPQIHHLSGECLVSGILESERQAYLEQSKRWGWRLQEELAAEGWLGFRFFKGSALDSEQSIDWY